MIFCVSFSHQKNTTWKKVIILHLFKAELFLSQNNCQSCCQMTTNYIIPANFSNDNQYFCQQKCCQMTTIIMIPKSVIDEYYYVSWKCSQLTTNIFIVKSVVKWQPIFFSQNVLSNDNQNNLPWSNQYLWPQKGLSIDHQYFNLKKCCQLTTNILTSKV